MTDPRKALAQLTALQKISQQIETQATGFHYHQGLYMEAAQRGDAKAMAKLRGDLHDQLDVILDLTHRFGRIERQT